MASASAAELQQLGWATPQSPCGFLGGNFEGSDTVAHLHRLIRGDLSEAITRRSVCPGISFPLLLTVSFPSFFSGAKLPRLSSSPEGGGGRQVKGVLSRGSQLAR